MDNTMRQTRNYNGIDLVKFICAFLVCFIHIPPFPTGNPLASSGLNFLIPEVLARIAVPFFFTASGFLLFRKLDFNNIDPEPVKKYCFNLLRLAGLWGLLLIMDCDLQLWYLGGTVVAVTMLALLLHKGAKLTFLPPLALILYLMGLLGDSWYGLTDAIRGNGAVNALFHGYDVFFETTRNGVFMGFPFVLMGAVFAKGRIKLKPVPSAVGFALSMALLTAEAYFLESGEIPRSYNMYLSLLPAAFFLFSLALGVRLKDRPVYKKLRAAGTLIFYGHYLTYALVIYALSAVRKVTEINLLPWQSFIAIAAVTAAAFAVVRLSEKEKFGWVKWFY